MGLNKDSMDVRRVEAHDVLGLVQHDILEAMLRDELSPELWTVALNWANRNADGLVEDYIAALVPHLVDRVPEIVELAAHVLADMHTPEGLCAEARARLPLDDEDDAPGGAAS